MFCRWVLQLLLPTRQHSPLLGSVSVYLVVLVHICASYVQGDEVDANISEVQKIQIKRYKLEKWAYEPFFEKTVVGCMVKVAYTGKYHVAEILEVQERELGRHRQVSLQRYKHKRPMFHWPYAEAVGQARMPPVNLC